MRCCRDAKKPCGIALCPVRPSEAALGHPRAKPSRKGRDAREQAYAAAHPVCEVPGCGRATQAVHHKGGRGLGGHRRKTAELFACCNDHHDLIHSGELVLV